MTVAVVCTVLNESDAIRRLMDSLCVQSRPADEIIVVDGGSRDDTLAVTATYVERLPLRVIVEPGANIARGRNVGIGAAAAEVIAVTDAGVWLEPTWIERLVGPLEAESRALRGASVRAPAVAGFFLPDSHTTFEVAMGATVLPAREDIDPASFLPSSRSVAFRKHAWEAAGGYPEWLDYCEDLVFDFRLMASVGAFAWAPEAVAHFRPRGSIRAFFAQYYRYARGDGKADLWRRRHAIRYTIYLVVAPGLLALSLFHNPLWLLVLAGGAAAYCAAPWRRLRTWLPSLTPAARIAAVALVPVIRVVGDGAKMLGYPAGLAWRIRNRRRPEIHWRTDRRPAE